MSRTIIGAILGFVIGGLFFGSGFKFIGAILGAMIGRSYDKRARSLGSSESIARIHQAFFKATFQTMGAVAKADGQVTKEDIKHAEDIFSRFNLSPEQRQRAISYFNNGKQLDFSLEECLTEFIQNCPSRNLHRTFIQILLQTAYVDGVLHTAEEQLIVHIASLLRISEFELRSLEALVAAQFRRQQYQRAGGYQQQKAKATADELATAYQILGADKDTSNHELKKIYRKLMSQHHPDKLASQGLPEEMIKVATEKTKEITWAYDLIKESRGIK
ncbi:MAG: co-chaperone DjlA [Gammaproteobacteria bacterium]|nr:MAG: co-chaperone DjlA [Gammaproteobacteria bacterium]